MNAVSLNDTDVIVLRRLIAAVEKLHRFNDSELAEAKLLASLLNERMQPSLISTPALAEAA